MHIHSDAMAILQKKDDSIGHTFQYDKLPFIDDIEIKNEKVKNNDFDSDSTSNN